MSPATLRGHGDRLYIFECGKEVLNHHAGANGRHRCPECKSKIASIIISCADCGVELVIDGKSARKKRCEACAKIRNKELTREANLKKTTILNQIVGVSTFDEFSSDCMPLYLIGQIVPRQEALEKINSRIDKIEASFDDTDPEEILSQLSSVELKLKEAETASLSRERIRQNAVLGIRKFIKRWRLRHPDLPNPIMPDVHIRKHHGLNAE